jgi:hypothetical protein
MGAFLGIAEDLIGVGDGTERRRVAGFLVIRVETLGLDAIHAMDGLLIGVGADLEGFVIVNEHLRSV